MQLNNRRTCRKVSSATKNLIMDTKSKKRILFIAPSPLYLEKGSSLRMYAILEILSKKYQVDLVTYSTGRHFELENVTTHRTPSFFKPNLAVGTPSFQKILLDFFMYLKIVQLSLFNKYDIVHCEDFEGVGLGYFSSWLNNNAMFVYDLHNRILDNLHLNNKPKKWRDNTILFMEKKFVKKSDKIILNWAKYENDSLLSTRPTFLYYDPIETMLADIEVPNEQYLIYSGNFQEYQGLSDFIPVFAQSNTPYKLYLVGNPSDKVVAMIDDLQCGDRVKVFGRKPIKETNALIRGSVCGILPRNAGSQPSMKLIHYFSLQKAVIATNIECNHELLDHETNGFLYKNSKELNLILKILSEKEIRKLNEGVIKTKDFILKVWNTSEFITKYES